MLLFLLFLPVLSVRDVLQLAGVAPAADDAVGGATENQEGHRNRTLIVRSRRSDRIDLLCNKI